MRPPILGSLLHAALVVGSAAQPRPPAQHAHPSLHDPLLVDPGGVAAEHEHGLRPHHSSGAAAEDPLLFRHRFQHRDADTGRLLYYQYEARRSSRVTMVEDIGVTSCAASDGGNFTTVELAVADAETAGGIALGDIIAGTGPPCEYADGSPWRQDGSLRERVIQLPEVHISFPEAILRVATVPAGLHECFDDSQLEFFHGPATKFEQARSARLASAGGKESFTFASTEEVLADALDEEGHTVNQRRRKLHDACPWDWNLLGNSYFYDIDVNIGGGQDCNVREGGSLINEVSRMENDECYWGSNGARSYKAGNLMQVRWRTQSSDSWVRLTIRERGNYVSRDATCYTKRLRNTPEDNYYDLILPDLLSNDCARFDPLSGGFPEFYIWIETDDGKHVNRNCKELPLFRMLSETDTADGFTLSAPPSFQFGDDTLGVQIGCLECRVTGEADVHILMRTSGSNPADEVWAWGEMALEAVVDIGFRARMHGRMPFEPDLLKGFFCLYPICYPAKIAGIGINIGVEASLRAGAYLEITAVASLSYRRAVRTSGNFAMHKRPGSLVPDIATKFEYKDSADDDSPPIAAELNVDATAEVSLIPGFRIGVFAQVGLLAHSRGQSLFQAGSRARRPGTIPATHRARDR